jgi:hypothetical protein
MLEERLSTLCHFCIQSFLVGFGLELLLSVMGQSLQDGGFKILMFRALSDRSKYLVRWSLS